MNTLNQEEEYLDGITWELEDDSTLPKHEASIYRGQEEIQLRISKHLLVDGDKDWSDIYFRPPKKADKSKEPSNKFRAVNKSAKGGRVNLSAIEPVNKSGHYLRFLDFIIRTVGAIFELLLIIILHILGIKKIRKTRRRKNVVRNNYSKRKARTVSKKYSTTKKMSAFNETRFPVPNWKKVTAEFVPSSNLYCYWCTKKLGLKSWELEGHYYCDSCHDSKNVNL